MKKIIVSSFLLFGVLAFANTKETTTTLLKDNAIETTTEEFAGCGEVADAVESFFNAFTGNSDSDVSYGVWIAAWEACFAAE
jgi:hypothetical protein